MIQGFVPVEVKCDACGKDITTNYYCPNGHHLCNICRHENTFQIIKNICLTTKSKNPLEIAELMMDSEGMSMLGCKQYLIATLSVYAAYKNAGGRTNNFEESVDKVKKRVMMTQTSMCKLGGFCGIPIAMGGAFQSASIQRADIAEITRFSNKLSGHCMSKLLNPNNEGSSDCCIRNASICIVESARFINNNFWTEMELPAVMKCKYADENPRCNREKCPFFYGRRTEKV